jgi:hypothetical protein
MTTIQKGYLVLADISGYTAFLTLTELEHSREILDQLLHVLVEHFKPPFVISKLEGDAVFAYAPEGSFLQAQTLLEAIEHIYFAFRTARDNIHRSCQCHACKLTASLDLKFAAHYGQFTIQTIGAIKELQGADVIVPHRLLKNEIASKTAVATYAFFTEASAEAAQLGDLTSQMIPHAETYDHLGEVHGFVHNLAEVWERESQRRKVYVSPKNAWLTVEFDLPVPPALAWDYLNSPQCACEWCGMDSVNLTDLKFGRLGVGSGRYCVHAQGKEVTIDTILDYQPFDYVTVRSDQSNGMITETTTEVTPFEHGSRILWRISRPTGRNALQKLVVRGMTPFLRSTVAKEVKTGGEKLRQMIEADLAKGKIVVTDAVTLKSVA